MYLPSTITSGQLEQVLRRVAVTVHNADGTTSQSNLFDQADAVRNGRVQVHLTARDAQLNTPAAAPAAAAPVVTATSDDDGITVNVSFTVRGL